MMYTPAPATRRPRPPGSLSRSRTRSAACTTGGSINNPMAGSGSGPCFETTSQNPAAEQVLKSVKSSSSLPAQDGVSEYESAEEDMGHTTPLSVYIRERQDGARNALRRITASPPEVDSAITVAAIRGEGTSSLAEPSSRGRSRSKAKITVGLGLPASLNLPPAGKIVVYGDVPQPSPPPPYGPTLHGLHGLHDEHVPSTSTHKANTPPSQDVCLPQQRQVSASGTIESPEERLHEARSNEGSVSSVEVRPSDAHASVEVELDSTNDDEMSEREIRRRYKEMRRRVRLPENEPQISFARETDHSKSASSTSESSRHSLRAIRSIADISQELYLSSGRKLRKRPELSTNTFRTSSPRYIRLEAQRAEDEDRIASLEEALHEAQENEESHRKLVARLRREVEKLQKELIKADETIAEAILNSPRPRRVTSGRQPIFSRSRPALATAKKDKLSSSEEEDEIHGRIGWGSTAFPEFPRGVTGAASASRRSGHNVTSRRHGVRVTSPAVTVTSPIHSSKDQVTVTSAIASSGMRVRHPPPANADIDHAETDSRSSSASQPEQGGVGVGVGAVPKGRTVSFSEQDPPRAIARNKSRKSGRISAASYFSPVKRMAEAHVDVPQLPDPSASGSNSKPESKSRQPLPLTPQVKVLSPTSSTGMSGNKSLAHDHAQTHKASAKSIRKSPWPSTRTHAHAMRVELTPDPRRTLHFEPSRNTHLTANPSPSPSRFSNTSDSRSRSASGSRSSSRSRTQSISPFASITRKMADMHAYVSQSLGLGSGLGLLGSATKSGARGGRTLGSELGSEFGDEWNRDLRSLDEIQASDFGPASPSPSPTRSKANRLRSSPAPASLLSPATATAKATATATTSLPQPAGSDSDGHERSIVHRPSPHSFVEGDEEDSDPPTMHPALPLPPQVSAALSSLALALAPGGVFSNPMSNFMGRKSNASMTRAFDQQTLEQLEGLPNRRIRWAQAGQRALELPAVRGDVQSKRLSEIYGKSPAPASAMKNDEWETDQSQSDEMELADEDYTRREAVEVVIPKSRRVREPPLPLRLHGNRLSLPPLQTRNREAVLLRPSPTPTRRFSLAHRRLTSFRAASAPAIPTFASLHTAAAPAFAPDSASFSTGSLTQSPFDVSRRGDSLAPNTKVLSASTSKGKAKQQADLPLIRADTKQSRTRGSTGLLVQRFPARPARDRDSTIESSRSDRARSECLSEPSEPSTIPARVVHDLICLLAIYAEYAEWLLILLIKIIIDVRSGPRGVAGQRGRGRPKRYYI